MKPNFALVFSADSITLAHRSGDTWLRIGDVPFDDPDLAGRLSALREKARRLPGDLVCKLVIPNEQIKYITVEAPPGTDPDAAVRAALEDATPYAISELEYDWTAANGVIQIAAVALETLGEAESFAAEHGFDAVNFAAVPDGDDFLGEPFFGVTRRAGDILAQGTVVDRDNSAIRITGDARIPAPEAAPKPKSAPADPLPGGEGDVLVASAAAQAVADAPPAPKKDDARPAGASAGRGAQPARSGKPPDQTPPEHGPGAQKAPDPRAGTQEGEGKAPASLVAKAPAAVGAFTSIRATRGGEPDTAAGTPPLTGAARSAPAHGADTVPAASAAPPLPSPAEDEIADPARLAELAASLHPDPQERLDRDAAEAASTAEPAPPEPRERGLFGGKAKDGAKTGAPPRRTAPRREDERQRMTVFGARQSERRGKPRFLGLILTALLLLFLVGVAAWASVYLDDGLARFFGKDDDIELVGTDATTEAEDPVAEGMENVADTGARRPATEEPPRVAALPETREQSDIAALPDLPAPLAPSEALARYAATGIWQMAPPPPDIPAAGAPLDDLYEVSLDPGLDLGDPADLPRRAPDARDTRPETPLVPPPAGTRFDFDARGLVRATPQGTLTPQGVRVIAGRPPLTPPQDMAQTVTVTTTAETAEPDLSPGTSFAGDPALAGIRPRLRPESVLAAGADADPDAAAPEIREDGENTATEGDDATRLASAADTSLARLRPQLRPRALDATAATLQTTENAPDAPLVDGAALSRAVAEANAAVPDMAEDVADAASFDNATPQAVTASLTPLKRPGDFKSTVERTRERAAAQPVPKAQRVQPAIPSSASVAKQATARDAINLRHVNLIGVYGSSANRRALVRLGNGSYQKVKVGDRLDGGQVAAIGDSELRYIKRGKNVVLRIPQG